MRLTRRFAGDVALALALGAFVVTVTTVAGLNQPVARPLDVLGYGYLVAAALPLLARRRFPLFVLAASLGFALAYYWSEYPGGPVIVLPALALYTLTTVRGPMVASLVGGGIVVAGYVAFVVSGLGWLPDARAAGLVAGIAAIISTGAWVRGRAAVRRASHEQAEERRQRLAEQERLRIAREVHDVVAHSLAMINVQAGVAAHVADRKPEQAVQSLRDIKDASATALADLRATLAVLRSGEAPAPTPSLRQLSELTRHAEAAGLTVRVHGTPGDLPAPTDTAAYRILQESLTNVVRHATGAATVDVRFERDETGLVLTVRDDGSGAAASGTGNGLRGMRERAVALGGQVDAGPEDGGFRVRAVLPIIEG